MCHFYAQNRDNAAIQFIQIDSFFFINLTDGVRWLYFRLSSYIIALGKWIYSEHPNRKFIVLSPTRPND